MNFKRVLLCLDLACIVLILLNFALHQNFLLLAAIAVFVVRVGLAYSHNQKN